MANTKIPAELVSDEVFGRRNLIINGDMRVAQRATSATVGPNGTGEGYQTLDRWRHGLNNTAVTTVSQSTTVPTGEGFANSMKIDVTTADTSVASSDFWLMTTKLEGQDLQRIKKGTSNAEKLTLSFWVRSTKTGVYVVELVDNDNSSRAVSLSYTIASADTWQKVELVFPADTTGAFDNDNNASLEISWWLIAGSNYSSGTLATTWGSQTDANRAVGQVNLFDSTSNEYYITGVQLEVGDNATPFEHLSYGEELSLCQRYYCVIAKMTTTDNNQLPIMNCSYYLTSRIYGVIHLPCQLRAAPSLEHATGTNYYRAFRSGASDYFDGFTGIEGHPNPISFAIYASSDISGTEGVAGWVETFNNAAYVAFDAEL